MATRPKKRSSSRRSASRRERETGASVDGDHQSGDANRSRHSGRRVFDGVAEAFDRALEFGPDHPLGRLVMLFLLQALEWQAMTLKFYQQALREGAFDAPVEEQLRKMARTMMTGYLDVVKSTPEWRERLLAGQIELAGALAAAVDDLRRRLRETAS
jgi:hypothetical protein